MLNPAFGREERRNRKADRVPEEFPEALAERIVGRIAVRAIKRFGAFPEYEKDDLVSEGLMKARECWHRYDRSKAQPQTFIYRVAWCHIQTIHRNRTRLGQRETVWVKDNGGAGDAIDRRGEENPKEPTMREWMEHTYRDVCERMRDRMLSQVEGMDLKITNGQAITLVMLKLKKDLTRRTLPEYLSRHPELLDAIGMSGPPSEWEVRRLLEIIPKLRFDFSAKETAASE